MSRLPFLWPSVSLLLLLFIAFSITNIFLSLPLPPPASSPHDEHPHEEAASHDHEDAYMDRPSIRLPPQPPVAFPPSAEAVHAAIASSSAVLTHLSTLAPADATVEAVLLPLAASEAALAALTNTLTIVSLAAPDAATLDLLTELNEHNLRSSATHPSLAPLLAALHDGGSVTDPESARYLHALHTGLLHAGAALAAEAQVRLELLQEGLSNLTAAFQNNLIIANSTLPTAGLNLTGVPPAALSSEGVIQLTPRAVAALLANAESPDTRHVVWAAAENSVPENVPLFQEMIGARHEAAGLLGYASWAGMRLAGGRMAPDAAFVREFLAEARDTLLPVAAAEVAELEAALGGAEYHLWDKRYAERVRERSEGAGMAFGVEAVLPGVLGVMGGVFGLEFVPVGREEWDVLRGVVRQGGGEESVWDGVREGEDAARGDMAWHPDVKLFAVWNTPDTAAASPRHEEPTAAEAAAATAAAFVGYLYLDLLARPSKTAQAGSLNIAPGHHHPPHARHYPSTAILTTFPASGQLSHADLVVLFHELGHAVHDLVSYTRFARHHGPAGVAVDFAEVPSRVGEEFAWDAAVLVQLGARESHARAVVAGRWEGAALAALRGVHIAAFDMAVHGEAPPAGEDATGGLYNALRREVIPVKGGEHGERLDGYATFGHLAMGYDAGYYGYLISSCYAADVWGVFEGAEGWGVVGRRWRGVLEAGGARGAGELMEGFLGRGPGCGVFYRRVGVEGAEGE